MSGVEVFTEQVVAIQIGGRRKQMRLIQWTQGTALVEMDVNYYGRNKVPDGKVQREVSTHSRAQPG